MKEALIKILQDFHLQIELLEGCQHVLEGDCAELSGKLSKGQAGGVFLTGKFAFLELTGVTGAEMFDQRKRGVRYVRDRYTRMGKGSRYCFYVGMLYMLRVFRHRAGMGKGIW